MKYLVSVLISICLLAPLSIAQRSNWQIETASHRIIRDAFLARLDGDSLVVFSPGFDGKIDVNSIQRMKLGKTHAVEGAVIGFVVGGVVGYVIGNKEDDRVTGSYNSSTSASEKKWSYALIGGVAGGGLGVLAGGFPSREGFVFEGKNSDERIAMLEVILAREGKPLKGNSQSIRQVVYLNNGSIIRGALVELAPDSNIKVITADSSLFVIPLAEVARIAKETTPAKFPGEGFGTPSLDTPREVPIDNPVHAALTAGIGIPVGALGEETGAEAGAAQIGFAMWGDLSVRATPFLDWLTSAYLSFQPINEDALPLPSSVQKDAGPWTLFAPMTGFRLLSSVSDNTSIFMQAQIGILLGSSPEITASYQGNQFSQPSSSATSFAFGFGFGVTPRKGVAFSLRYLYANPEYEITASGGGYSLSVKSNQPTSVIYMGIGFVF